MHSSLEFYKTSFTSGKSPNFLLLCHHRGLTEIKRHGSECGLKKVNPARIDKDLDRKWSVDVENGFPIRLPHRWVTSQSKALSDTATFYERLCHIDFPVFVST